MEDWEVEAMEGPKSFVAYFSWWEVLSKLDDHQKALILEAMFSTGGVCEKPELDFVSEIAFIPIEREIKDNLNKWERTKEARREAGSRGGKAKAENAIEKVKEGIANLANAKDANASLANASNANAGLANLAIDIDIDIDSDIDMDRDIDIDNNAADAAGNDAISPKPQQKAAKTKTARQHFEELWKLYPNKRGKSEISDNMKDLLLDVPVGQMKEAVNRYVHEVEISGFERHWMNGSTWFNGRFLDYIGENYQPPKAIVKARKVDGRYRSNEGFRDFSRIEE